MVIDMSINDRIVDALQNKNASLVLAYDEEEVELLEKCGFKFLGKIQDNRTSIPVTASVYDTSSNVMTWQKPVGCR